MITLKEVKHNITEDQKHWVLHLMDFVDDFRYYKNADAVKEPFEPNDERMDALLASTASQLCSEMGIEIPHWLWEVPACREAWFVGGMDSLRAIALVESPMYFRLRQIFVLENFLSRA